MKQDPLSIIVPTLNEAENIPALLKRIHGILTPARIPYEVIIVDDHSTDATVAIARDAARNYPVRVQMKRGKPGKAFSLLEGFDDASYDLVCMIDADLQYPPEAIAAMYHKLQFCNADVVVTERVSNKTSLLRRLSTSTFNFVFTKMLFGIDYDTQSGLKLFRKRVLNTISLNPSPWSFDLEFIVRALEQDYTILSHQIPFSERYAGVPKVHLLSTAFELASASLRLRRNTAGKRVRSNYKYLQIWQQSFVWLLSLLLGTFFVLQAPGARALPLSVLPEISPARTALTATAAGKTAKVETKVTVKNDKPKEDTPKQPTTPVIPPATTTPPSTTQPQPTTPVVTTPAVPITPPVTTTPPVVTTPAPTTTPQVLGSATTPASTPTKQSTSTRTPVKQTTTPVVAPASTSVAATPQPAAAPEATNTSSAKLTAAKKTSPTNQTNEKAYYNGDTLSSAQTSQLLKIAIGTLAAAGVFLATGVSLIGARKLQQGLLRI